jgi:hypothetical protein
MNWALVLQVVGAIGGVAAIAGGVAAFVGNLVSSRFLQAHKAKLDEQLETHKDSLVREADRYRLLLKRQELMFEKEYTAGADFFQLFASIVPDPWAPDLDWSEAQVRIAENLFSHEQKLKSFLSKNSAALGGDVRRLIEAAKMQANQGGFEVARETDGKDYEPGTYPSKTVCDIVDKFYEKLNCAETQLRKDLQVGSFGATTIAD